jgi:hypothetical protein
MVSFDMNVPAQRASRDGSGVVRGERVTVRRK